MGANRFTEMHPQNKLYQNFRLLTTKKTESIDSLLRDEEFNPSFERSANELIIGENMKNNNQLILNLSDNEWPLEYIDHDRQIARAIAFDDEGYFYFVRVKRDDDFGKATCIETAGGGVEAGEDSDVAILRELEEELGAVAEVLCKVGVVSDYYNLIHRHNINNYYLCKISAFGEKHMTKDEIESFHLSTLKLSFDDAVAEYERCATTPLGRLIANRELPVLMRAGELLNLLDK